MTERCTVAILGAGPTGIGAAWRLEELGFSDWRLFERSDHPGGLATSIVDNAGFTWDLGGHVLFSHYEFFDAMMVKALGDQWVEHQRESWVWIRERWVPYPFQNNIWRLPPDDLIACIDGLLDLQQEKDGERPKPQDFRQWLMASFGRGLCDIFMVPYNRKVWAYDPSEMNVEWMGERVATVDLRKILRNLVLRKDEVSWGPNATFRFPLRGGTGAIWNSLFSQLPASRCQLGREVVSVDTKSRTLRFNDGGTCCYEHLISTIPMDRLLAKIEDRPDLSRHAENFVYSSSHIIGIGMSGSAPEDLRTKCWMYFPEEQTPFNRVTVFSNYSPNNVPRPGQQWSLMAEVSESPKKPVDAGSVVAETIAGLKRCGLITDSTELVSTWHRRLEHGYPTPWLGRDQLLNVVEPALRSLGIWSRGRFGLWKYEVANQDHSVMQGVWAVEDVLKVGDRTPGKETAVP